MKTAFAFALVAASALAADANDRMGNLPNAPPFTTNTYSGYLDVTATKRLHYVFAESETNVATDPVIIWFNGGPGCSSMLGFMQENGPLAIDDGEDYVKTNPFPWNYRANMLWIESPAGVGWSVGETAEDLVVNDMSQSVDAFAALEAWYVKFPEFMSNDLFVSGESYAGIYVPYLTWQIYENNLQAAFDTNKTLYNLKGMMVGNGCTDWNVDTSPAIPETTYNFQIIPKRLLDAYQSNDCKFYGDPTFPHERQSLTCIQTWADINAKMARLNIYDLYRQTYPSSVLAASDKVKKEGRYAYVKIGDEIKQYKRGYTVSEYTPWLSHLYNEENEVILGDYVSDYMNQPDVRAAFNIPQSVQAWQECTNRISYHELDECSLWIYPILKNQVRILKYSGDTDGAVPTYGTKEWIKMLNWDVLEAWRPWYTNGQVSGYVTRYDGLDFVTVKGVGHMAPQWAREPVQTMILAWAHNESF